MYNFVQKYFAQIVHFCIDNNNITQHGFGRTKQHSKMEQELFMNSTTTEKQ